MAKLGVHGNWKSIAAFASLFALVALILFAVITGESLGIWLYVFSMAAIVFGFMSKEDHFAVGGITGLFLVVILDIALRIGLLGFTECKDVGFSIIFGC